MKLVKSAGRFSLSGDMADLRAIHARLGELLAAAEKHEAEQRSLLKDRFDPTHAIALGLPEVEGMDDEDE